MKKTKIIVPAMGLLLLGTAASVTGTVAWFSMNTTVNVAGMQVRTSVGNNLSIAPDVTSGTALKGEEYFSNSYLTNISELVEPVSTVDGLNFYYTVNAKANGDAIADEYNLYGDTSAFNTAYGTTGAVGYVDYAFQLKAVNAGASPNYLQLTELNLAYIGTDSNSATNAFRVAIFFEQYNKDSEGVAHTSNAFHALGAAWDNDDDAGTDDVPYGTTTLMKNASAANFTSGKAVNGTTTLGDVTYGAFNYVTVPAGETNYYKVVVRLWLEGEDNKCSNGTFANLNDKWALSLAWQLAKQDPAAKANITNTTPIKLVVANYTVTAEGKQTISATDYNVVEGLTYNGMQVYTTQGAGPLANTSPLFTIAAGVASSVDAYFTLI